MTAKRIDLVGVIRQTYSSWRDDRTIRLGAGLAYYGMFTIVPLMAVTAALAELLFGNLDIQTWVAERASEIGIEPSDELAGAVSRQVTTPPTQSSLGIIGMATLVFSSSLLYVALADAVNVIWDQPVEVGAWAKLRQRLKGFLMVLVTGGVLILDFAVSAVAGAAEALLPSDADVLSGAAQVLPDAIAWVVLAGAMTLLIRFLSPVTVRWRIALVTGTATAALLAIATWAVGLYIGVAGGGSLAGAAGSIVAFLTWVFVQAQIVLIGVQFSKALVEYDSAPAEVSARTTGAERR